ncbi:DUF1993 domain-containing protein [Caldimonas sp. KR1-144]|uniref:DUF1993 domain-containing protein n=1 Tax=Caldimonas sp. KR1-144 TaxID=3400911 RepID=UPI003BFBA1F6
MSITMHSASVPIFKRTLANLAAWLDKAQAHAEAKRFDTGVYLQARLAPDMLPFVKQVQIACDSAKLCVARLTGVEAPKHADTEASFDELRQRIAQTIAFIESVPAERFAGTEAMQISVPRRSGEPLQFDGESYLKHFALPNFFFHCTTAYALLRHNGVDLGKQDFLGAR